MIPDILLILREIRRTVHRLFIQRLIKQAV